MKNETYCSACLKRCGVAYRDDSFDHGFGTERIIVEAPDCHPEDDLISRKEAVTARWHAREMRRIGDKLDNIVKVRNEHVHPVFQGILNQIWGGYHHGQV